MTKRKRYLIREYKSRERCHRFTIKCNTADGQFACSTVCIQTITDLPRSGSVLVLQTYNPFVFVYIHISILDIVVNKGKYDHVLYMELFVFFIQNIFTFY